MMSEAKLDEVWIPKEILPVRARICTVKEQILKTKRGDYTAYKLDLEVVTPEGPRKYDFTAAFGDKNFLINTVSPQPEKWIGTVIEIFENENGYASVRGI